jgi:hypothetical protein
MLVKRRVGLGANEQTERVHLGEQGAHEVRQLHERLEVRRSSPGP